MVPRSSSVRALGSLAPPCTRAEGVGDVARHGGYLVPSRPPPLTRFNMQALTLPAVRRPGRSGATVFFFFSNRLGCTGSLLVSLAVTAILVLIFLL